MVTSMFSVDQTLAMLSPVEGLDTALGLKRVLDRRDTYLSMLNKFVSGQADAGDRAMQALQSGDMDTLRRIAHTLKGNAATLGAMPLAEAAAALDRRLKDLAHSDTLSDTLKADVQNLCLECKTLFTQLQSVLPSVDVMAELPAGSELDWTEVHALLYRLQDLLADSDADAVELFQSSQATVRAALPDHHAAIHEALEQYDLDQALIALQQGLATLPTRSSSSSPG